jgi:hypothetical protein
LWHPDINWLYQHVQVSWCPCRMYVYFTGVLFWICLFCMGPIYQRKHNPTRTGTTYWAARYVTNHYHNTSSISNMIVHLLPSRSKNRCFRFKDELCTWINDELMVNDWNSWFEWLNRVTLQCTFRIFFFRTTRELEYLLSPPRSPKGEGGILFYLCPSVRPSKIFFVNRVTLQCTGGDCSSFVSFVERKIAVWVANVCVGECMFRENLTGGMSMSVFGIATSSCVILYNMTRCASDLRSARLCQFRCPNILLTLEVLWLQQRQARHLDSSAEILISVLPQSKNWHTNL